VLTEQQQQKIAAGDRASKSAAAAPVVTDDMEGLPAPVVDQLRRPVLKTMQMAAPAAAEGSGRTLSKDILFVSLSPLESEAGSSSV